jgi:hypothetical protein
MAPARLVERILQEHVGRGDLVDNGKITGLAPKFIEPTALFASSLDIVFPFVRMDTELFLPAAASCSACSHPILRTPTETPFVDLKFLFRSAGILRPGIKMRCFSAPILMANDNA